MPAERLRGADERWSAAAERLPYRRRGEPGASSATLKGRGLKEEPLARFLSAFLTGAGRDHASAHIRDWHDPENPATRVADCALEWAIGAGSGAEPHAPTVGRETNPKQGGTHK